MSGRPIIDLRGRRFSRLLVEAYDGNKRWICRCDCGVIKSIAGAEIRRGKTLSCGCLAVEILRARATTHGLSRHGNQHPLYAIWHGIIDRCTNPRSKDFPNYGGRGITVLARWTGPVGALCFVAEVAAILGDRPSASHSIDRIDNHKGYEPGNIRWATPEVQAANRRPAKIDPISRGQIAWLVNDGGFSRKAVARAFDVDPATVRLHLRRAA